MSPRLKVSVLPQDGSIFYRKDGSIFHRKDGSIFHIEAHERRA
jgi:hypothetical protein